MFIGTAGDTFSVHNGEFFSTMDKYNDCHESRYCALYYHAGWWFDRCFLLGSYLNGVYGKFFAQGIKYYTVSSYYTRLSYVEIKIRETRTGL